MAKIDQLLDVMAQLRDPQSGCPWDVEQTFATIAPFTIEEAYEVADAIEQQNYPELCDELGDLLLNVVFHAQMAKEAGHFGFDDVVDAICDKMIRRHPHVFSEQSQQDGLDLHVAWEAQKAAERQQKSSAGASALDGVARALPALMRAQKLAKRASRVGFDWQSVDAVCEKICEELAECKEAQHESQQRIEEEVGDLLFAVVNLARHTGVDAEQALRKANDKFQGRFEAVEHCARTDQRDLTDCAADQLDAYWQRAKKAAKPAS